MCGRRRTGRDMPDGRRPVDVCAHRHNDGAGKTCQGLRGDGMAAVVAPLLFAAIAPAPLPSALEAIEHREAPAGARDHQWHLRLERARYEAELARRRAQAVEPTHRVVARSWERAWNAKVTALDPLARDATAVAPAAAHHVRAAERQRIVACAYDRPTVGQADTTTQAARKQGGRFWVQDVPLTQLETTIRLDVRWPTHAWSPVAVARPHRASVSRRTGPEVVARGQQ